MENDLCKKECVEEKHVAIINSLKRLEEFICRLEGFVSKVKLCNNEDKPDDDQSARGISLENFLNETPEDIAKMTARMDKALTELIDLLF